MAGRHRRVYVGQRRHAGEYDWGWHFAILFEFLAWRYRRFSEAPRRSLNTQRRMARSWREIRAEAVASGRIDPARVDAARRRMKVMEIGGSETHQG
ncbi:hypothetical protein J4U01_gp056 [Mycobacterium phage Kumao]|uniref:Uncharacterized protein n=1 Tax=Mycobacterium phage Kumao TaxID=2041344 RepID=A0A2D1GPP7_9CAUD|nr:hypothetical protein J4U01_gp056 [Mycobacterium phage Kumao]ATN94019.1 hypothetical protein SEA_KUMAO_56 [Mycobacterium phage Kumao]